VFISKRRKYSPEFKPVAAEQVRQPGVSCTQVARERCIEIGISARRRREVDAQGKQACGGSGKPRDL